MPEDRQLNRTWLCSVLFTDLVNYSSQSVETQSGWKTFFNRSLVDALKPTAVEDRVIIDTGDGAAVCFLGDPESAVLCSLDILNDFLSNKSEQVNPPRIRLGIHLGPVKLVQDINGNTNAIGDGINVGQRIMSFAGENQILVSRSYFEVVSRLSDEYSRLFRFEGVRQDKHVREHAIYALVPQSSYVVENEELEKPPVVAVTPTANRPAKPDWDDAFLAKLTRDLSNDIGPIAKIVVDRAAQKATNRQELLQLVADSTTDSPRKSR